MPDNRKPIRLCDCKDIARRDENNYRPHRTFATRQRVHICDCEPVAAQAPAPAATLNIELEAIRLRDKFIASEPHAERLAITGRRRSPLFDVSLAAELGDKTAQQAQHEALTNMNDMVSGAAKALFPQQPVAQPAPTISGGDASLGDRVHVPSINYGPIEQRVAAHMLDAGEAPWPEAPVFRGPIFQEPIFQEPVFFDPEIHVHQGSAPQPETAAALDELAQKAREHIDNSHEAPPDCPRQAVKALLRFIGDDPERPGLLDTPDRVLKAWIQSWGAGYHMQAPELRMFKEEGVNYDQMVVVKDLAFFSTCEHHMAPFFGRADIAYIPDKTKGVLGLSKFARVLEFFARRLQVQERLNEQVAAFLAENVSKHVAVVMHATHMCMVSRGVQQPNAITSTSVMKGYFLNDQATRNEFFRLTKAGG